MLGQARRVPPLFARRSLRVVVLSVGIVVMSVADLYLTLLFVTQTGMDEMNPLARAMMEYQSPMILALWKMGTVVISIGILIAIRKQRSAELGAWIGCLVMGSLMFHWIGYIDKRQHIYLEMTRADGLENPAWIMISTDSRGGGGVISGIID